MNQVPMIQTSDCEWKRERETLVHAFGDGSFPRQMRVQSAHTGLVVSFVPVQPGDPMFDEDGWDGEQMIYRSADVTTRARYLVLHRGF